MININQYYVGKIALLLSSDIELHKYCEVIIFML